MKPAKVAMTFLIPFSMACTKDHRNPDSGENISGQMIAFLGCTSTGIQAGKDTYTVTNDLSSFSATYKPAHGGKVVFSYSNRRYGVSPACGVSTNFITVTAIRNE